MLYSTWAMLESSALWESNAVKMGFCGGRKTVTVIRVTTSFKDNRVDVRITTGIRGAQILLSIS